MKLLGMIAIVVVVAVVCLLAFAATKPNSFRIERTIRIKGPPQAVYALVNDFHQWTKWSPWEHMDTDLKRTYGGPEQGVGSTYEYAGKKTGAGKMKIIESEAPGHILASLDFIKPIQANNFAEFTFRPEGDETVVTWSMYGKSPFISKLMGVFFNIDKMVGGDFEKGLKALKAEVEKG